MLHIDTVVYTLIYVHENCPPPETAKSPHTGEAIFPLVSLITADNLKSLQETDPQRDITFLTFLHYC